MRNEEDNTIASYEEAKPWDLFVYTPSGRLRRVTLPESTYAIILYMMTCSAVEAPESTLDGLAHRHIERLGCTYAEAWTRMAEGFETIAHERYLATFSNPERAREMTFSFVEDQTKREALWRRENEDYRDPLPPAFD